MVESIYFLKPAWCGTHFAGLWPEQGLQPVTRATALRRWFVTQQDTPDQYHVAETVQTPQGSRNMGLDTTNHRVFIVSAKFGPAPAPPGRGRGTVLPGSFFANGN